MHRSRGVVDLLAAPHELPRSAAELAMTSAAATLPTGAKVLFRNIAAGAVNIRDGVVAPPLRVGRQASFANPSASAMLSLHDAPLRQAPVGIAAALTPASGRWAIPSVGG